MDPANLRAVPLFSTMEEQDLKKIATFAAGSTLMREGDYGIEMVASSPMRLIRLSTWEVKRLPQETRDRLAELVEDRRARP